MMATKWPWASMRDRQRRHGGFEHAERDDQLYAENDAPVLDSASLTVSEGQTVTPRCWQLWWADPDSASFTYGERRLGRLLPIE